MYGVVKKIDQINVRVKPDLKSDLETLAEYHGLTVSSYVHSVLVREVRRERISDATIFETKTPANLAPVVATITPAIDPKAEVRRMINDEELAEAARRTTPRKTQRMAVLKQKAK